MSDGADFRQQEELEEQQQIEEMLEAVSIDKAKFYEIFGVDDEEHS